MTRTDEKEVWSHFLIERWNAEIQPRFVCSTIIDVGLYGGIWPSAMTGILGMPYLPSSDSVRSGTALSHVEQRSLTFRFVDINEKKSRSTRVFRWLQIGK